MTENKKTLLFSVLGVILLLVVVIGVSYAMYTFTANGTKENTITTGTVSISYAESSQITLENVYPSTDATGAAVEGHDLVFTVSSENTSALTINYEVALANVTPGATLTADKVKFNLKKGDGTNPYLLETSATTGITIASRASNNGSIITTGGYLLDAGTLTGTQSVTYTLRAWVSDEYDLPQGENAISGGTQTNASTSETFSFGVKVQAQG